jgi:hypothetical protein
MTMLDIITFASYVALTADIVFQIRTIRTTCSSHDISIIGISIRYAAILIILYKFMTLSDWPLVLGQGLLAIVFTAYLTLVLYYRKDRNIEYG